MERQLSKLRFRLWLFRHSLTLRALAWRRKTLVNSGVKLRLHPCLSLKLLEALVNGTYEPEEAEIVGTSLTPDDVVMELGTGLGFISALCAMRIGSERVHTYEANPELEPLIRETFAMNRIAPDLQFCLLGESEGTDTLYIMPDLWSSSTVRRDGWVRTVQVPRRNLRQEMARVRPTFLIVDIEGAEYELFRSIDLSGVNKCAIELHERVIGREKTDFVRQALALAGFVSSSGWSDGEQLFYERANPATMWRSLACAPPDRA
jgi:FkbM family methyltransferase